MKKFKYLILPIIIVVVFLVIVVAIANSYILMIAALFNSQGNSSDGQNIDTKNLTEEVNNYKELVIAEAKANKKLEYVPLFLAVMMQESGGRGNDVFQCSVYLGKSIDQVTPEESIKGGVELLSINLDKAAVSSPKDILKIKLALQTYNFGGGYMQYALERDGKWTQENTDAFAKKQSRGKTRSEKVAKTMGKWDYGDQYYTSHVLRYYNYSNSENEGTSGTEGPGKAKVVEIAKSLVGCEYEYGFSGAGKQFDCSGLVYYCYSQAGYRINRLSAAAYSDSCEKIAEADLEPGDLIFYQKRKANGKLSSVHHVAIYVGNGMIVHAKGEKYGVVYEKSSYASETSVRTFGRINAERKKQ